MWRVLPTQRLAYATNQSVLSYYIMHYYLLIGLLSVLTSLDPILLRAATLPPFGNNCTRHAVQIHPIPILLPPFSFLRFEKYNLTLPPPLSLFSFSFADRPPTNLFFFTKVKSWRKLSKEILMEKEEGKSSQAFDYPNVSSNNKCLSKLNHGYKIESPFFLFLFLCLRE